jgi:purine nucleosidase
VKVLLDTDIGNDIDDALTLAYLLAQPECELLGITTVTAGAADRARLASALCLDASREVPIAAGASRPLEREPLQEPPLSANELLTRWPHREPSRDAIELLRQSIVDHPGEITLITIGALTNVAQLFQAHPETATLLRSLVLMGGRYFTRDDKPEWNIRNDPEAAQIVFEAPVAHVRAVGIDVTRQVMLSAAEFRSRFSGLLLDFAGPWLAMRDKVTFHDPLAAATVFDETLCGYVRGTVRVEPEGWTNLSGGARHEVAQSVAPERFFAHYFEVVGACS